MNWKVGDTAVSLFNIFQTNRNYPDLGTELKVKAGERFVVLEVTEIENHLVLDIGLTRRIKILEFNTNLFQNLIQNLPLTIDRTPKRQKGSSRRMFNSWPCRPFRSTHCRGQIRSRRKWSRTDNSPSNFSRVPIFPSIPQKISQLWFR